MEYYSAREKGQPAIYDMYRPWGHYAKWNKLDEERQMHHCMISYVQSKKIKFIETDQMGGCQRPGNWE